MQLDLSKLSVRVQLAMKLRPPLPDAAEAWLEGADYLDFRICPAADEAHS